MRYYRASSISKVIANSGLSFKEFSEKTGVSRDTLFKVRKSGKRNLSVESLQKIANAMGVGFVIKPVNNQKNEN